MSNIECASIINECRSKTVTGEDIKEKFDILIIFCLVQRYLQCQNAYYLFQNKKRQGDISIKVAIKIYQSSLFTNLYKQIFIFLAFLILTCVCYVYLQLVTSKAPIRRVYAVVNQSG